MITRIYALLDENNKIRYIGKTIKTLSFRLNRHIFEANHNYKNYRCNWIRSMLLKKLVPTIMLIGNINDNENLTEIGWIAYGKEEGWKLTNSTSGGEGVVGLKHSVDSKLKMKKAHTGKNNSFFGIRLI